MDLDAIKEQVAQIDALEVLNRKSFAEISVLREQICEIDRTVFDRNSEIRRCRLALVAHGVHRITYFEVRDRQFKKTKFVFLKDEDYFALRAATDNFNTHSFILRFETIVLCDNGFERGSISFEDIAAAAAGPRVEVAVELLRSIVAEWDHYLEASAAFRESMMKK
jgi:hypothetical protein